MIYIFSFSTTIST